MLIEISITDLFRDAFNEPLLSLEEKRKIFSKPASLNSEKLPESELAETLLSENYYPLRGAVISYDDPFEPATSSNDWEVM